MCQYSVQVLNWLREKHQWLQVEYDRLKATTTNSEMMVKEDNSNYKANMRMEVAQGRVQLAIEKGKL